MGRISHEFDSYFDYKVKSSSSLVYSNGIKSGLSQTAELESASIELNYWNGNMMGLSQLHGNPCNSTESGAVWTSQIHPTFLDDHLTKIIHD